MWDSTPAAKCSPTESVKVPFSCGGRAIARRAQRRHRRQAGDQPDIAPTVLDPTGVAATARRSARGRRLAARQGQLAPRPAARVLPTGLCRRMPPWASIRPRSTVRRYYARRRDARDLSDGTPLREYYDLRRRPDPELERAARRQPTNDPNVTQLSAQLARDGCAQGRPAIPAPSHRPRLTRLRPDEPRLPGHLLSNVVQASFGCSRERQTPRGRVSVVRARRQRRCR